MEQQRKIYPFKVYNTQSKRYITHSQYTYQLMCVFFSNNNQLNVRITNVHLSMVSGIRNMSPLYYVRLRFQFFGESTIFLFRFCSAFCLYIASYPNDVQFQPIHIIFFVMIQSILFSYIRHGFPFHLGRIYSFIVFHSEND